VNDRASVVLGSSSGPSPAGAAQGGLTAADPLSDVLRAVRLDGAFFYAVEASEPWSVEAVAAKDLTPRVLPGAEHLISYHILTSGHCWGGLTGQPPVALEPGDVIVFPHGDAHVMSSDPALRSVPAIPGRYPATVRIGEGGRVGATFVCGFLGCDRRPFNPLLATLPRRLHLPGLSSGWRESFARQVVEESRARRAGAGSVLTRLAELMFVEVLRRFLETLSPEQPGWLAGLRDDVVGRGLGLLHGAPAHPWTIEELASAVAMSRSAFADRFTALVGQPPMQYLAQWRMQLGAARLVAGDAKVAAVAEEVGYDSEAAFSRAFKRVMGVSPAAWRAGRGRAETSRAGPPRAVRGRTRG
jgi:AraC-like DNA-binding protein